MSYDLLEEKWIPVRCKSGARRFIAPWQIVETADPPIDIDTGRPDFDCAGIQFLIGLLQTAYTPPDEASWRRFHDRPPTAEQLRTVLGKLSGKFELLGDGARFMQDLSLRGTLLDKKANEKQKLPGEAVPIQTVLVDCPGGGSHFAKANDTFAVGAAGAAFALLSMQLNAPGSGRGYRTSIRGGGPLTTWVVGGNLWETAWGNVLYGGLAGPWAHVPGCDGMAAGPESMPWLADWHAGDMARGEGKIESREASKLLHFWAMPMRFWLMEPGEDRLCDLLPRGREPCFAKIARSHHGLDYGSTFQHPLSPHFEGKKGIRCVPAKRDAVVYSQWPKLATTAKDQGCKGVGAALVVRNALLLAPDRHLAVAVAGYDSKSANARAWVSGQLPLLPMLDPNAADSLRSAAERSTAAAEHVARLLCDSVRAALLGPKDKRGRAFGGDTKARLLDRFWSTTEADFYRALHSLRDAIASGGNTADDGRQAEIQSAWCASLFSGAVGLFDEATQLLGYWEVSAVRRIAKARELLLSNTKPECNAMRKHVGLGPVRRGVRATHERGQPARKLVEG